MIENLVRNKKITDDIREDPEIILASVKPEIKNLYPEFIDDVRVMNSRKEYVAFIANHYKSVFDRFVNDEAWLKDGRFGSGEWDLEDVATFSISMVENIHRVNWNTRPIFPIKEQDVPYCAVGFVKKDECGRFCVTPKGYKNINSCRLIDGKYPFNTTRKAP